MKRRLSQFVSAASASERQRLGIEESPRACERTVYLPEETVMASITSHPVVRAVNATPQEVYTCLVKMATLTPLTAPRDCMPSEMPRCPNPDHGLQRWREVPASCEALPGRRRVRSVPDLAARLQSTGLHLSLADVVQFQLSGVAPDTVAVRAADGRLYEPLDPPPPPPRMDEDYRTGDMVCSECGACKRDRYPGNPYRKFEGEQTRVHWEPIDTFRPWQEVERLSHLICNGKIHPAHVELAKGYMNAYTDHKKMKTMDATVASALLLAERPDMVPAQAIGPLPPPVCTAVLRACRRCGATCPSRVDAVLHCKPLGRRAPMTAAAANRQSRMKVCQ